MKKIKKIVFSSLIFFFFTLNLCKAIIRTDSQGKILHNDSQSGIEGIFISLLFGAAFVLIWFFIKNWISKNEQRKKIAFSLFWLYLFFTILALLTKVLLLPIVIKDPELLNVFDISINIFVFGPWLALAFSSFFSLIPGAASYLLFKNSKDLERKKYAETSFNLVIIPGIIVVIIFSIFFLPGVLKEFLSYFR